MEAIFIHIARTGGTSIKEFLRGKDGVSYCGKDGIGNLRNTGKHFGVYEIWKHIGTKGIDSFIEKYFLFAFTRNPFTRLQSYFHHARKMGHRGKCIKNKDMKEALRLFMKNYKCNLKISTAMKPQYDYLEINGQLCTNFLGRYESFANDVTCLKKILGITKKLGLNHASDSEYDGGLWDQEHIDFILKEYEKDFHILGYPETPWL